MSSTPVREARALLLACATRLGTLRDERWRCGRFDPAEVARVERVRDRARARLSRRLGQEATR